MVKLYSFYVLANDSYGNGAFSEQITIDIKKPIYIEQNQKPYFQGSIPDLTFNLSMTERYNTFEILLPPIEDVNENFKTIIIESSLFGIIDSATLNRQ